MYKSHIYIAGSYRMMKERSRKNQPVWKFGKSNNILDRFIFSPNSYNNEYPSDSYIPKLIWHWVDDAYKIENMIKLAVNDYIIPESKTIPYCSEVTVGLDKEILKDIINKTIGFPPTFEWDRTDFRKPFANMKKLIHEDSKNLISDEEYREITQMVISLSGFNSDENGNI